MEYAEMDLMQRNASVELYRCVLMLGLVAFHVIGQGGFCFHGAWYLFRPCLDGFVFISGFYGINLSRKKIYSLVLTAFWCCAVSYMIAFSATFELSCWGFFSSMTHSYWFIWAYLALMCFAPVINQVATTNPDRLLPICFLVFGWSYMAYIPVLRDVIPNVRGCGSATVITLIGIYSAGRYIRVKNVCRNLKKIYCVLGIILLTVPAVLGLSHFHSPISLC